MKKLVLLAVVAFATGMIACKPATQETKAPETAVTPPPAAAVPVEPAPATPPPAQPGQ